MRSAVAALIAISAVGACGSGASTAAPSISQAWVAVDPNLARPVPIYLTIESRNGDRLTKATVARDIALRVDFLGIDSEEHSKLPGHLGHLDPGGSLGPEPKLSEIPIRSGGATVLKPGGAYLALADLERPLRAGDRVPLTLYFASGAVVIASVEVRGSASHNSK